MVPIVVAGKLISPTQVELESPVPLLLNASVQVHIRPQVENRREATLELLRRMAAMPPGNRTKEDIDRQIREEREGWEHRR